MPSISILLPIARAEARVVMRSWVFRFFAALAVFGLGFANMVFFVPQEIWSQLSPWMVRSIPSSIPYFTVLVLTMFESIVVMFCAVDSLRREYTFDTADSLHARDFDNIQYVTGKALGVLVPFVLLDAVILCMVLVINGVFMTDVPVDWIRYFFYPLLITLPALVFVIGLSFVMLHLIQYFPLALIILVGVLSLPFVSGTGLAGRIFDYNAIHLPLLYSDFVGFGNIGSVLLHRVGFLLLGLGLIALSSRLFRRLSQSVTVRRMEVVSASILGAVGTGMAVLFLAGILSEGHLRERMQTLNEEYVHRPRVRMTACDLSIIHRGSRLAIRATVTVTNPTDSPIATVSFSLNPGYSVEDVSAEGRSLQFSRDTQMLDVELTSPLGPGDVHELSVSYSGRLNDHAAYPDIDEEQHRRLHRMFSYVIDKRHGFVTPDYILLTPESLWYPSPGVLYGIVYPDAYQKDFVDFSFNLMTDPEFTVITQGDVVSAGDGRFQVIADSKLTGLTLIAGDYEERSTIVDSVAIKLFTKPGHDYFAEYFEGYVDTTLASIRVIKQNDEHNRGMKYPYNRYLVVEAPIQFYAYERPWRTYMDTVQPQMSIMPEKGCLISNLDIRSSIESYNRYFINRGDVPDRDMAFDNMRRVLLQYVFIRDQWQRQHAQNVRDYPLQFSFRPTNWLWGNYMPGYTLSAQYHPFILSVESPNYPIFDTILAQYRKNGIVMSDAIDNNRLTWALLDEETAAISLQDMPFRDYVENEEDFETLSSVIEAKTTQLFGGLAAREGFDEVLREYYADHKFESVPFDSFAEIIDRQFGTDIKSSIDYWYQATGLPLYNVSETRQYEIVQDERTLYQSVMTVSNLTSLRGHVSISAQIWDQDLGRNDVINRLITLNEHESKEIGFVTDLAVSSIYVNTIMSRNLPLRYHQFPEQSDDLDGVALFDNVRTATDLPESSREILVVDNLDPGFAVVRDSDEPFDESYYAIGRNPEGFIIATLGNPPSVWGKAVFANAYGPRKTIHYTKPGPGDGEVCWTTEITEAGSYDLEFFTPSLVMVAITVPAEGDPAQRKPVFGDYSLTIRYADTKETIITTPLGSGGWQHIAGFELPLGEVSVSLTNESNGRCVCADAIRWVKKSTMRTSRLITF